MLFVPEVLDVPIPQIKKAHDFSRAFPLSFVVLILKLSRFQVPKKSENAFMSICSDNLFYRRTERFVQQSVNYQRQKYEKSPHREISMWGFLFLARCLVTDTTDGTTISLVVKTEIGVFFVMINSKVIPRRDIIVMFRSSPKSCPFIIINIICIPHIT